MSRPIRAEAAGQEPEISQEQAQAQKVQARRELLTLRDQVDAQKEMLELMLSKEKELAFQVEGKPSVYSQLDVGRASDARDGSGRENIFGANT